MNRYQWWFYPILLLQLYVIEYCVTYVCIKFTLNIFVNIANILEFWPTLNLAIRQSERDPSYLNSIKIH